MSHQNQVYQKIGIGCCGSVWTLNPSKPGYAVKLGDGDTERSVKIDSNMHQLILLHLDAIQDLPFCIPSWHDFISQEDNERWLQYESSSFPAAQQMPYDAVVTERLPSFDLEICQRFVDRYCPAQIQQDFKKSITETYPNCILRLYLGKEHESSRTSKFVSFSLNNMKIWSNRAQDLGVDTVSHARTMAQALALLHWVVGIDANDVEWVLAPPRKKDDHCHDCDALGRHCLWLIDFDCCRNISMDEQGIKMAVESFWKNDPYYPRPGPENSESQSLWNEFKDSFLLTSEKVLRKENLHLAMDWVKAVEVEATRRRHVD